MRMARLVARTAATPERSLPDTARPGGPAATHAGAFTRLRTGGSGARRSMRRGAGRESGGKLAEERCSCPGNRISTCEPTGCDSIGAVGPSDRPG